MHQDSESKSRSEVHPSCSASVCWQAMEFAYTFARRISIGTKERCCPSGVSSSWSLIAPISISRCTASSIAVLDGGSRNRCSSPLVEATANLIGEAVFSRAWMDVPTGKQVQVRCQKQLSTVVRNEDLGGRLPETVSNLVLCWSITHRCSNPAGIWRTHRSLELLARELSMRRYSWSIDTRSTSEISITPTVGSSFVVLSPWRL